MACIVDLFSELGGSPEVGGNWYVTDGPVPFTINDYGPCPLPGSGNLVVAAIPVGGVAVGTGENICIDLTGVAAGDYEFTYVVPSPEDASACNTNCVSCATVTISVLEAPVNGAPVEYCANDNAAYFLYPLLGNAPSTIGEWDKSGGPFTGESDGDGNGANDTFTPSSLGVGVHTFTYTVTNDPGGCAECIATVVVTVVAAPTAGENGSASICV